MTRKGWFDIDAFHAALDGTRRARGLNWKQVAAETGVTASTLTRMGQGKRPDANGLAALSFWSGLDVDDFVRSDFAQRPQPETLAMISTYLRGDRSLSAAAAGALEEVLRITYEQLRDPDPGAG